MAFVLDGMGPLEAITSHTGHMSSADLFTDQACIFVSKKHHVNFFDLDVIILDLFLNNKKIN